ncbi:hypothetical protein HMPREF1143_1255 [Peptoanaerobacter stomatis]|uniref:Uncharacterized protein n=1 Tax=Peptoanaerobacter stomatis TaxID=796937 RepID=J5URX7_9FIRM|nr:hypothetical protein HMPREF1143_1255 [Peptoanaerobacter stomatis]
MKSLPFSLQYFYIYSSKISAILSSFFSLESMYKEILCTVY